ncbi:MAG: Radical domain protein [Oscillospiraceae bacterium]|nr:Radical domain protein [Oscillospiraceae bacterium]
MIHRYSLNGYNIVLDVHSGGIHIIDDITYEVLGLVSPPMSSICSQRILDALGNRYSNQQIIEAYSELYELFEQDLLFSKDDYEQFANQMVASPVKAMCLNIAHDCNLRCEYCFASTGDFGQGRRLMDFETGKAAVDFLLEHSKGRKNLEMDFFGGEPLMNFDVVKQIVEYARSKEKEYNKNFRFTITTNGLLLTEDKMDYINKQMSNVVLSLDGRKEINDKLRKRVDGTGCYDTIVLKYKQLVDKRGHDNYYVRGTFTKHNLDFSKDVQHLNELGFDQLSVEPVVGDPSKGFAISKNDLPRIFDEYENLAQQIIESKQQGKGFNFFHFMLDLDQGPCAIKRLRGCGCGNEYVAVTPDGDIYPCHQFVGMEEWKMGTVYEGKLDFAKKDRFSKAHVYEKEKCKDCWAKFYCSGGCNANNFPLANK